VAAQEFLSAASIVFSASYRIGVDMIEEVKCADLIEGVDLVEGVDVHIHLIEVMDGVCVAT
jgi:molybdenum cofactor biosynthesis enzyme MoaA